MMLYSPTERHAQVQVGGFKLGQRLCTVLLRGTQFFLVGFGSSALGHTLTIQLVRPITIASFCSTQSGCNPFFS